MTNDKDKIFDDEFKKYYEFFTVVLKWSQSELAERIGIDATYLSKMCTKVRPVSRKVLKKLHELWQENVNKSPSPEKVLVQENLPLTPNEALHEVAKLEAVLDKEIDRNSKLQDRVAVLEERLKQSNADSEKKIYELEQRFAYTIRTEIERSQSRLSRPRTEANG